MTDPIAIAEANDAKVEFLRKKGGVIASFYPDGSLQSITLGPAPSEKPRDQSSSQQAPPTRLPTSRLVLRSAQEK